MRIAPAALLVLLASGLALAADFLEQVSSAEKAVVAARSTDDAGAMDRLTGEDFIWVRPNGQTTGKKELLEDLRAHRLAKVELYGEQRIRIFGNTAVVTGRRRLLGPVDRIVMDTNVWVNRDGRWQRVSAQSANVQ